MNVALALARIIERGFFPLAVGCSALALAWPGLFTWFAPFIPQGLGLIMFGMGLALTVDRFADLAAKWRLVLVGLGLQCTVMPGLALALTRLLHLPPQAALGVILVGACPGGTASNVITYLARGNLALSVTLTLASTMLSPLTTPTIVYWLCGARLHMDFWAMVGSVFWIVAFPVCDGLIIRRLLYRRLKPVLAVLPALSILLITLIIACVVGLTRDTVLAFPGMIILAVVLHNLSGFSLGYAGARLFTRERADAVAIAVEVGMQNSGLGVDLAKTYFSAAAALPAAIFSLEQNLAGIALARWWSRERKPLVARRSPGSPRNASLGSGPDA